MSHDNSLGTCDQGWTAGRWEGDERSTHSVLGLHEAVNAR